MRRAQKKFSELLIVFFIGPNRKQRSLVGEVLTAHIRKVKVCAGDIYRQICNFYTKIAQFFLPQRAGVNVILADGVALVLRIVNRDALSLNRAARRPGLRAAGRAWGVGLKIFSKSFFMDSPTFLKKSLMLADWTTAEAEAAKTGAANSESERQNKYHSYNSFECFFHSELFSFHRRLKGLFTLYLVAVHVSAISLAVVVIGTFADAYTRNHSDFCKTKQEDFCDRLLINFHSAHLL